MPGFFILFKCSEVHMEKTNAMRLLDSLRIGYDPRCYVGTDAINGTDVASVLNEDPATVFKTLITVGKSERHHAFLVPVSSELDLKKAAACVDEKSVMMIPSKELLPLTGYIHGGCSPLCMKHPMDTVIDSSALNCDKIFFSAGKIGYQIGLSVIDLNRVLKAEYHDIIK